MKCVVIDVRDPDEYMSEHVKDAVNIPLDRLMEGATELENIPKETSLIVYCQSGGRANVAQDILKNFGFTDIVNGINKANVESNLLNK